MDEVPLRTVTPVDRLQLGPDFCQQLFTDLVAVADLLTAEDKRSHPVLLHVNTAWTGFMSEQLLEFNTSRSDRDSNKIFFSTRSSIESHHLIAKTVRDLAAVQLFQAGSTWSMEQKVAEVPRGFPPYQKKASASYKRKESHPPYSPPGPAQGPRLGDAGGYLSIGCRGGTAGTPIGTTATLLVRRPGGPLLRRTRSALMGNSPSKRPSS